MDSNRATRIWQVTAILLTLCNIGLILTLWLKPAAPGDDRPRHRGPRNFVIRSLKFSDEQVAQYDELIYEHQHSMRMLREEAMGYRQQLFAQLRNGNGAANRDSLEQLIGNTQKQIERVTYDHFAQVRQLCNADQKKEFDNIITDVIRKMNGGMHPPPMAGPGRRTGSGLRARNKWRPDNIRFDSMCIRIVSPQYGQCRQAREHLPFPLRPAHI